MVEPFELLNVARFQSMVLAVDGIDKRYPEKG